MNIDGFKIEIVRSKRRKRTIQAKLTGDNAVRVMAPYHADDEFILDFINKTIRKFKTVSPVPESDSYLKERACMLRDKYIPKAPNFSITYSDRLKSSWGKCFFRTREIVINTKLASFPRWVSDMVIIHEIAHLIYPNHGKQFRELVSRYRLRERATGYLMAKGLKAEEI